MTTALAAYCSECRTHVFVAENGGCEHGHPRPNLRGLYTARVDRRTGRPQPPSSEELATSAPLVNYFVAPVAPIAEHAQQANLPTSALSLVGAADVGGSRGDLRGLLGRLFATPKGKHSSVTVALLGAPKGRHSAGAKRRSA